LVVDDDQIKSLIENNPHTTREIAEIIDVSQRIVVNHLHTLGYFGTIFVGYPTI